MKKWVKMLTIASSIIAIGALSACSSTSSKSDSKEKSSSALKASSSKKKEKKEDSLVTTLNQLAAAGKTTDELYVTGKMNVGKKNSLKPGIYDLTVTGGEGNIEGERKAVTSGLFINWAAGVKSSESMYPSTVRIILFEGDTLEFSDISKVKFTAVPENVTESNQLGIGEYVVGRDIKAGTYKLSSNQKMNPEFENLGWDISIYNDNSGEERDQSLNPKSTDVAVELKDGEIVSTDFDNVPEGASPDDARLIFTPVN